MYTEKKENLNQDHYVVASNRMYCVGNQDGSFSPLGFHVDGEMSGIFSQPVKIASGFQLKKNGEIQYAHTYAFDLGASVFTYNGFNVRINALDDKRILALHVEKTCEESLTFQIDVSLKGCWTWEEVGFKNGKTIISKVTEDAVYVAHEKEQYFAGILVSEQNPIVAEGTSISIEIKRSCDILILANHQSLEQLVEDARAIQDKAQEQIENQRQRRGSLLTHTKVDGCDDSFAFAFDALKLNYDMLVQKTDAVGESYTAGYPEFQWLFGCDTTYGIHGTLAVGQFEMTKKSLRLLKEISLKTNGMGRVVHEVSSFGYVYNEGNLQESPHFIIAVAEVYRWTGDREFLKEMFDFCVSGMAWVESMIEKGAHCPVGSRELAYLCEVLGKQELIEGYNEKRLLLEEEVLEKFYSKESEFFGDVICTIDEIRASRDILVHSIKNTKTLTKHMAEYFDQILSKEYARDALIPLVLKNWVTILPYAQEFVPEYIKEIGVKQMLQPEFYNHHGMKLACMCNDKDDEVEDVYTLNKSMSINTGYLAEVFAKNGHLDRAYALLLELADTMKYEMPVALSEILPDDGCFMQFWSGYGIHHVFLRHILGIVPDAGNKQIVIKPQLPKKLSKITIQDLRVGDCIYQIQYKREQEVLIVDVKKNLEDYQVIIEEV